MSFPLRPSRIAHAGLMAAYFSHTGPILVSEPDPFRGSGSETSPIPWFKSRITGFSATLWKSWEQGHIMTVQKIHFSACTTKMYKKQVFKMCDALGHE